MIKTKSLLILISTLLFSNYYLSFSQELTITTYYPSPVGIYKELRAKRMAIGDNFYDPSHYCWEGSCTVSVDSDADLIVEGKVGIKTENPQEELHVAGDTEIEGGVVIGNPEGGNKGTGTINAEKIYVDGSEIGGGGGVIGGCMDRWNLSDNCWDNCQQTWGKAMCKDKCLLYSATGCKRRGCSKCICNEGTQHCIEIREAAGATGSVLSRLCWCIKE